MGCSQIPAFYFNFKIFFLIIVCTSVFLCFEMCEYIMLFLSRLKASFMLIVCIHIFCFFVNVGDNVVYLLGHIVMVLHRGADV